MLLWRVFLLIDAGNKKSLLEFQMCDVPHFKSFSIMPLDSKKMRIT